MVPVLPQTLETVLKTSFQPDTNFSFHFEKDSRGNEIASVVARPPQGDGFKAILHLHKGGQIDPENSSIHVEPEARGYGLGKKWLRSVVETGIVLGNGDFRFKAGDENGAYTWAKAGVAMDMAPQHASARTALSQTVITRLEALKLFLRPREHGEARALSRFTAKDDINNLAAMDISVPQDVLGDLQQADSRIGSRLEEFYQLNSRQGDPKMLAARDKNYLSMAFDHAERQQRPLSLARCILAQANWPARIDFGNTQEMQVIGSYLGGWKTVCPAGPGFSPDLSV